MTTPPWRQYQEDAAAMFRSLGLDAETDVTLTGARGPHDVDVVVRGRLLGVDLLWIVECKYWSSAVKKEQVLTLASVMDDLGADRAILLSESGFQSGAPLAASHRSVTLCSLEEFRDNAAAERDEAQLTAMLKRVTNMSARALALTTRPDKHSIKTLPGVDGELLIRIVGRLSAVRDGLTRALAGEWPVLIDITLDDRGVMADEASDAASAAQQAVDWAEFEIVGQERLVGALQTPYGPLPKRR